MIEERIQAPTGGNAEAAHEFVDLLRWLLTVGGDPFVAPRERQRQLDPTLGLPYDVRRAVARRAATLAPDFFEADEQVSPLPLDAYPDDAVHRWARPVALRPLGREAIDGLVRDYGSLDAYYAVYPLLLPQGDGQDEHFAEREFLEHVFMPVLGSAGLSHLAPQVAFRDADGRQRRIDFVLRGAKPYAIEIEGRSFHDAHLIGEERFEDEKVRQHGLADAGYEYRPFSYGQIVGGEARRLFAALCASDPVLGGLPQPGGTVADDGTRRALWLAHHFPSAFRRLQLALLPHLRTWLADGRESVTVASIDPEYGLAEVALWDLLALAHRCLAMFPLDLRLPRVDLSSHVGEVRRDDFVAILAEFLDVDAPEAGVRDRRVDGLADDQFTHALLDGEPTGADFMLAVELVADDSRVVRHEAETLASLSERAAREPRCARPRRTAPCRPTRATRATLDYFARRYFVGIAALHPEQATVVASFMEGASRLVVLPTAFGKSLCFQLPALLLPGALFVVSPLRALMRDQLDALAGHGIGCADAVSSQLSAAEKASAYARLADGQTRLFYLSPERVLIRGFTDEVAKHLDAWGAWGLAVDEAHCVSEWGHDFRPSYLHLNRFRRILGLRGGAPVPVLALTATASETVREDIRQVLGIEEPTVSLASIDRREISLSVHREPLRVRGDAPDPNAPSKPALLGGLLREVIPMALGRPPDHLVRDPSRRSAVVVFTSFANPHGRWTMPLGVADVRAQIVASEAVADPSAVRVHASTTVEVCPQAGCGSHRFTRGKGGNGFLCQSCGTSFEQPRSLSGDEDWLAYVSATQDAFKEDEFHVLVATNGYGMGIDKRNIRAVVHYAMASGLEAYYQEVGRAGRDRQHAHAALLYASPHPTCERNHLSDARAGTADFLERVQPACVTDEESRKYWQCPYGLERLCDVGFQARFIAEAYPSEARDVDEVMECYDRLARGGLGVPAELRVDGDERLNRLQLALYRLRQLRVLRNYSIEYRSLTRITVHARSEGSWDTKGGRDGLRGALVKLAHSATDDERAAIADGVGGMILPPNPRDAVRVLVTPLVAATYRVVKSMRYRMLLEEWRFAREADHEGAGCRRAHLRSIFGDEIGQDYRCGFCDVCRPDLRFHEQGRASGPAATLADLTAEVPRVLGGAFDAEDIERLVDLAAREGALGAVQGRAERVLQSQPDNQAAFAVAGLAALRRGAAGEAFAHFADGYRRNEQRGVATARLAWFYAHAREADPRRALDLADRLSGPFDTPDGRRRLMREALEVGDEARVIALRSLLVVETWSDAAGHIGRAYEHGRLG